MKALSIRQPWAWLIVRGYKPVENRTWRTSYRGPLLIHAAKGMTRAEYEHVARFLEDPEVRAVSFSPEGERVDRIVLPAFEEIERGGVVGSATLYDCTSHGIGHELRFSGPWFFGPHGLWLRDAKVLPFHPCRGQLGIFEVDCP